MSGPVCDPFSPLNDAASYVIEDDGRVLSPSLTPREIEVLTLAADGLSGPELAEALVLSPATIRTHFKNIYAKLDVRNRSAAVAKAMRLGIID
jgi:ATP/maltotriose-dependent transcriptional regulator MalT